jgi:hypothetical protein
VTPRFRVRFQLIFRNGAVEGLVSAFYAVLELPIPLRKLSNYFVWTRRSVPRWNSLAEAHHVPGDEAMPGRFVLVQLSHCESFSCVSSRKIDRFAHGATQCIYAHVHAVG